MMNIAIRATLPALLFMGVLQAATTGGTVANGVYTSALKNYSVRVPAWDKVKIQDNGDADFGIVSFLDRGDIPAPLQAFVTQFAIPDLFQRIAPKTALVHEEFLDRDERRLYFAVANIPGGHASLQNPQTRKMDDSVSGLLVFHNKGFMYMVRVEMKTVWDVNLKADALTAEDLKSAQQSLFAILDTMTFVE